MSGEFDFIRDLLRPLAHLPAARGLLDDVAVLPSRPGYDLVMTKDALVEGVHFLADDPLDTVAQKVLRVSLSDLAAKGAEPFGYLLACAWSARCGWSERELFVEGLKRDQAAFSIGVLGGDTVSTPGPASFSATMLGWAPAGAVIGRDSARIGDGVYVTGRIGDGWLGLRAARGDLNLKPERREVLVEHYRRPMPQTAFADLVRVHAKASVDISDGLIADLGHIAEASGVRIRLDLETVPLSAAGHAWFEARADARQALVTLATGGDDYEIAFTADSADEERLRRAAAGRHVRLTRIGDVVECTGSDGRGVEVRHFGQAVTIDQAGWDHG